MPTRKRELWGHDNITAIEVESDTPEGALREAALIIERGGGDFIDLNLSYTTVQVETGKYSEGMDWQARLTIDNYERP